MFQSSFWACFHLFKVNIYLYSCNKKPSKLEARNHTCSQQSERLMQLLGGVNSPWRRLQDVVNLSYHLARLSRQVCGGGGGSPHSDGRLLGNPWYNVMLRRLQLSTECKSNARHRMLPWSGTWATHKGDETESCLSTLGWWVCPVKLTLQNDVPVSCQQRTWRALKEPRKKLYWNEPDQNTGQSKIPLKSITSMTWYLPKKTTSKVFVFPFYLLNMQTNHLPKLPICPLFPQSTKSVQNICKELW